MTRGTGSPVDPDALVAEFKLYDRAVDVVSAYHWLFTETADLPTTVSHFERYPKVKHSDGNDATPDFTVLFKDGTGIAAEIANIALHDNSVEKLCTQLDRYSRLTELPAGVGRTTPVAILDVLYLSPMETAAAAVQRVLRDRVDNPDHSFKPVRRPTVVQFVNNLDRYIFQFWPDERINGSLYVGGRTPNYGLFTEELKVPPAQFARNKVTHGFMNDPVKPLYMATRLWTSVFPSKFGTGTTEFTTTVGQVAVLVRGQYGHGTASDVRAGMRLLVAAGLATEETVNTWKVKRRNLRSDADDVHVAIAERVGASGRRLRPARRAQTAGSDPPTLFDDL